MSSGPLVISREFVRGMTTTIQCEAALLAQQAINTRVGATVANQMLPAYRPLAFVTHNNYSSTGGFFGGGNTTVNHIVNQPSSTPQSRKEKEENSARMCAWVGSILSVAGAALVGYSYSLLTAHRESLRRIRDVRDVLYNGELPNDWNKQLPSDKEVLSDFMQLVHAQLEIDELNTQKITNYFLAAVGMLAGGVALASGGFMMVPVLMTGGKITLLLSAIAGALNGGLHLNDASKISKNYKVILGDQVVGTSGLADRILSALHRARATLHREQANREMREQVQATGSATIHVYESLVPGTYVLNGARPECVQVNIPANARNISLFVNSTQ